MRRKNALPELLAPAGDTESLYAAVAAGADAVYIGGKSFGARAFAKNFDIDEIARAAVYCHLHGVKLYVTVNTLIYDREMREVSDFAAELWRVGVDALIVADIGVIRAVKKRVPDLPIHASTQMSVHNTFGADTAAALGCERVVLARELSFENIEKVTAASVVETEVFLHGALCVSHSGQCLMSSLVGGRSGNRGECAQPCRLSYNGKYPLSLSDLSLANHIEELIMSGVASLKIEGRMKSPDYVYTVTKIYRTLLDEGRNANREENELLARVFSRGGFTDGYFTNDKFSAMTGIRTESDKEKTRELAANDFSPVRVPVSAEVVMKLGQRSMLTLTDGKKTVTVYGEEPATAHNAPLTEDGVKARLSKMGQTFLSLDTSDIKITLDAGINLPPSAINALRRDGAAAFENTEREPTEEDFVEENFTRSNTSMKTSLFLSANTYYELKEKNPLSADFFDIVFLPLADFSGICEGVYIPPIVTDTEIPEITALLKKAKDKGAKYALVGNIGHLPLAKSAGLVPIGDFRLNITNSYAMAEYKDLGVKACVISPELTLPMARDIGGGETVYGRIPLMLTERCFIKENFGCEKCTSASLRDRTGAHFPIVREYGHRNLILNSRPTYMGDRKRELADYKIKQLHFIFTVENPRECDGVITSFIRGISLKGEVRRIGKR